MIARSGLLIKTGHSYRRFESKITVRLGGAMARKSRTKLPNNLQVWVEARQRYHLSDAHIQMARELGLNPRKFGKIANHRQEPWKAPLPQFIEEIYLKRFGKTAPDKVLSIEETARAQQQKQAARKERKRQAREAKAAAAAEQGDIGDTQ